MKKFFSGLAVWLVVMGLMIGSAFAEVTIDTSTGKGFVGKGDVQFALGYNNSQMQKAAGDLVFTQKSTETYAVTVSWLTGEGKKGEHTHYVTHNKNFTFNSDVAYEARKSNQYTGFILKGFSNQYVQGNIPNVGDQFPGNSGHEVIKIELISNSSSLYVNGVPLSAY